MKNVVKTKLAVARLMARMPQNFQFLEFDCQKYKQMITFAVANMRKIARPP